VHDLPRKLLTGSFSYNIKELDWPLYCCIFPKHSSEITASEISAQQIIYLQCKAQLKFQHCQFFLCFQQFSKYLHENRLFTTKVFCKDFKAFIIFQILPVDHSLRQTHFLAVPNVHKIVLL